MVGLVNSSSPGSTITQSWTCDTANRVSTSGKCRGKALSFHRPFVRIKHAIPMSRIMRTAIWPNVG